MPGFALCGGRPTAEDRDAAGTRCSDEDIAWVRPGNRWKNSGTATTPRRRFEHLKEARRTWPRLITGED